MRINDNHWLVNTPIAHRGLHSENAPENSIAAFQEAAKAGYAIELDLRFSKDGKVVVFHDATLDRMTNGTGLVIDYTYDELFALNLKGGGKIPLLTDTLFAIKGKVPFLIEVKDQPERKDLVKKTVEILKTYKGEYALQSFNPFYVRQFKKFAPEALRGQLASKHPDGQRALVSYMLRNFYFNFLTKPDFISFNVNDLPFGPAKRKNTRLICWTVNTEEKLKIGRKNAENIIFENIVP